MIGSNRKSISTVVFATIFLFVQGSNAQQQAADVDLQGREQNAVIYLELAQLEDMPVRTLNGQELGDIEDIVMSNTGSRLGFRVSVGGFYGIGSTDVFVPAAEVRLEDNGVVWHTRKPAEQIVYLSSYEPKEYDVVTGRYATLSDAMQTHLAAAAQ